MWHYFKFTAFITVNRDLTVLFKMVSESHYNKLASSANATSSEKEMKLLNGMRPSSLTQKVKNSPPYTKNIQFRLSFAGLSLVTQWFNPKDPTMAGLFQKKKKAMACWFKCKWILYWHRKNEFSFKEPPDTFKFMNQRS